MKPEILTHPNIPKPLHGLAPRVILGQTWWDNARQEAYKKYNYTCVACGIHKSKAKKYQWLEAHEFYSIDYEKGIMEIESIEPLCHYCHNFIHSGRLQMIAGKEKTQEEIIEILEHGLKILSENSLECFSFTLDYAKSLNCQTFGVKKSKIPDKIATWEKWYLIIDGKSYKSKFSSEEEWQTFYENKNNL